MDRRRAAVAAGVVAVGLVGVGAAVTLWPGGESNFIPMTEERLAHEIFGNEQAARCAMDAFEQADISPDAVNRLLADTSNEAMGSEDDLDAATDIIRRCRAGGVRLDDPGDVDSSSGTVLVAADGTVATSAGQLTAPPPEVYSTGPDGGVRILPQPATVVAPFERLPERASNRGG